MAQPLLIFDLDGTLVDSLPGITASLLRSLHAHGLPGHSNEAVRSFVGDGLATLVRRAAPQGADAGLIESLIRLFKADYAISWKDGTVPYDGVSEALSDLQGRGYRMAVLSNKTDEFTVEIAKAVFPEIHFLLALGQRDGMPPKPDPAGALHIAAAAGVAVEDCMIIGDSSMDLETAARAGMHAIAVTWGYHDRSRLLAAGARWLVDHPDELARVVDAPGLAEE